MNWTLISATNNDKVLESSLLRSPDLQTISDIILQRGYASATAAFNNAIEKAKNDLIVIAHQDVYLPPGWLNSLERAVDFLSVRDPDWGVLGVWGVNRSSYLGFLYCGANGMLGENFEGAREIRTLDEVLLVVRKSSNLRFDESLPGFHMYGADICLEARRRGMKSYVIPAFCIHNTNGYRMLPWEFWRCYLFMRKKWRSQLPIATSCVDITKGCWPIIRWNLARAKNLLLKRHRATTRVEDPRELLIQSP
jgi:GT2 family glycosyltransferase